ncbi:MAG: TetM/TetW/TetO/TetS family tetracycline resistance ribosomal protection protein [Clostridia bacterium]|nr:TetM/TetW/TetO/TetS family tetracycline resistance ribosomal protection protein [Clostridia bacterium]
MINFAILAHVDAGKTTLTESILYHAGTIRTLGRVDDGTAQSDYLEVEKRRGISVRASQTSFSWKGEELNLIDTPGHVDFSGEVERSLAAVDGAVLVISAVEGIQSHTETIWRCLRKMNLPVVVFINKIDRAGSDCQEIANALREQFGVTPVFLSEPVGEGSRSAEIRIPDGLTEQKLEAAADDSDEAAEAYLEGNAGESETEIWFRDAVLHGKVIPVVVGSAISGLGTENVLNAILKYLPKAEEKNDPLSALVYRVEHDKTMGRIAHVRLFSGELKSRDTVAYPVLDGEEARSDGKISQIRKSNGQKMIDVGRVGAGDVAALCGLTEARVYDWFGEKPKRNRAEFQPPFLTVKVMPKDDAKLTNLVAALSELEAEDPLLGVKWEKNEREIVINITGKIELEILGQLILDRYQIETSFSEPSVIYKETPAKAGRAYADYLMPKPCWAIVEFLFEPLPRGSGVVYDPGRVPHNQLFYKYQEHIRRSFFESLSQGIYGWEATDFKATLVGGGHHTIHTHPLDFFVATPMAVMNGFTNTGMTLLEPYLRIRISAGEEYMGRILGDITQMRGEFDTPVVNRGIMTVDASVPAATSMDYPIRLASLTGGRGIFRSELEGWRDCPMELGKTTPHRGVDPRDRSKWILFKRGAYQE